MIALDAFTAALTVRCRASWRRDPSRTVSARPHGAGWYRSHRARDTPPYIPRYPPDARPIVAPSHKPDAGRSPCLPVSEERLAMYGREWLPWWPRSADSDPAALGVAAIVR